MPPASIDVCPPQKAALSAVKPMETKMRSYTITELFCMTRAELFALHQRVVAETLSVPESDPVHALGLANLRLIRRVLAKPGLSP
jgi:hypothetical protein